MATEIIAGKDAFWGRAGRNARNWLAVVGSILLLFLCWLITKPFLPAVCWAFGLALIAYPFHQWLCRKVSRRNLAAAISVIVIAVVLVAPAVLLTRVVVAEATEVAQQFTSENLRSEIRGDQRVRTVLDWLGSRVDLQQEVALAARRLAGWISSLASLAVTSSIWFLTQIIIMVYLLFYFLRDGQLILSTIASVLGLQAQWNKEVRRGVWRERTLGRAMQQRKPNSLTQRRAASAERDQRSGR